ncbi:MAG TPA: pilus assembly protein TadG-related protein [Candidatus Saccharimonadales bacterium]|nr:pilus assembly protein TadG-related protein [Candidatus Saccharimonadales bacterium]
MRPAPNRRNRRSAKGQAMAIFALVSVLLFVVAGLAVDAGTSYLSSNRIERAAAAAALAGVAYLPGDIPDATNAALVEAARDGFPNAGAANACVGNPSPCVVTSEPTTNELKVTISATVGTIFLRIVGFGSHTVVRSETAQYLPPISLGQPGGQQGAALSDPSCTGLPNYCASPASGLGSGGNNYYFERQEGWGNPRSEGDPFTPSAAQSGNGCGPGGSGDACSAAAAPDFHQISTEAGTAPPADATLNYAGGSNYLITIPNGQSADPQIFNPAFAADTCDGSKTAVYCYHENDSSFAGTGAPNTAYSAMEYTLYQVSTLSSRSGDTKVSQEVFYPYNATGLSTSSGWFYYCSNGGGCSSTQTNVTNAQDSVPATYHQWVSALKYAPSNSFDKKMFKDQFADTLGGNGYIVNNSGATEYFRLEVDTLEWNGVPACPATSGPCANPSTGTNAHSEAHKGYAVRLVTDAGSPAPVQGTVPGSANCSNCSMSAMDDMVVFTPVNGASTPEFKIPLFAIDPTAYAGQTINVDLFDIGDVGGGPAYVGLQQPDGTTWATANSVTDLGASLAGASPPSGGGAVTTLGTWPGSGGGSCTGCFQTAGGGGGAIYQGQWVQMQIQIPASFTGLGGFVCSSVGPPDPRCYWNLVYDVSSSAVAGDTFGVEVGFGGSPDHLLP